MMGNVFFLNNVSVCPENLNLFNVTGCWTLHWQTVHSLFAPRAVDFQSLQFQRLQAHYLFS